MKKQRLLLCSKAYIPQDAFALSAGTGESTDAVVVAYIIAPIHVKLRTRKHNVIVKDNYMEGRVPRGLPMYAKTILSSKPVQSTYE